MNDLWHLVTNWLDHNRGLLLSVLITGALSAYLVGCDVTTSSLISEGKPVTREQFIAEIHHRELSFAEQKNLLDAQVKNYNAQVEQFNSVVEVGLTDLERKEELRGQIIATVGGFATQAVEGRFNPLSALSALIGLISLGAAAGMGVDNYRKNRVIEQLKSGKSMEAN